MFPTGSFALKGETNKGCPVKKGSQRNTGSTGGQVLVSHLGTGVGALSVHTWKSVSVGEELLARGSLCTTLWVFLPMCLLRDSLLWWPLGQNPS